VFLTTGGTATSLVPQGIQAHRRHQMHVVGRHQMHVDNFSSRSEGVTKCTCHFPENTRISTAIHAEKSAKEGASPNARG